MTNLNSLNAQEAFRVHSEFQAGVIQRLTSGYRISRSGDDPAGLAIANRLRADTGELSQGIRNLNDGISRLQIVDGGIDNRSKILDRLKVLASQSATDTFTGDRITLNSEFQTLLGEIDRQAESVGLHTNGQFATLLPVFVGGRGGSAGVTVNIDLRASAVDARGLGLGGAKGMQAVAGNANIGPGSPDHTVAQIVQNTSNTTATPGRTPRKTESLLRPRPLLLATSQDTFQEKIHTQLIFFEAGPKWSVSGKMPATKSERTST